MRWLWALVMVASASNSTCPGCPSATHAKVSLAVARESLRDGLDRDLSASAEARRSIRTTRGRTT